MNQTQSNKLWQKLEGLTTPQGSRFRVKKDEYEFIMDLIREENPLPTKPDHEVYSKQQFLKEVYLTSAEYDTLVALLENKQNLILQGLRELAKRL